MHQASSGNELWVQARVGDCTAAIISTDLSQKLGPELTVARAKLGFSFSTKSHAAFSANVLLALYPFVGF